ncbi:hypothetical protein CBM2592_B160026 [Cupriavidus taiwanensis]|nr:hypothetical protein CBM2588_B190153 [Cupriavidus taiwanensis]SOY67509.1 hypothetical protein CBM2592_B160026 [Cupriavidus taiwanensis]SOY94869.1 hypothetical protein CBM2591_B150026 [Cupriavidus taiwanensis]SOZ94711.1 hypothetical protein CBM2621_B190156 [Cupriavidus taiwanensis]SPA20446.1 hypothetical protein CBM2631_B190061 [Cupriavidus taiwanensis]
MRPERRPRAIRERNLRLKKNQSLPHKICVERVAWPGLVSVAHAQRACPCHRHATTQGDTA